MGGGPARDLLLCILPFAEPQAITAALRQRFPSLEIIYIEISRTEPPHVQSNADRVPPHLWQAATILCTLFTFPARVEDAPNLQLVHLVSAGSNQIQRSPLWNESKITITTSSGIHGPQIAEWAVMTSLVASHKYNQLYELQKQHRWGKQRDSAASNRPEEDITNVRDQVGCRLGVLGYGSIGRQIGRVAKAMGMDVIVYTASPKDTPESRRDRGFIVPGTGDANGEVPSAWYSGVDQESLHHFLRQHIDWLVISVPLTDATTHMLDTDAFAALTDHGSRPAFVTNIARGPIIKQSDLIQAIKSEWLMGAALDVTDPEPLPSSSELWDLRNVIVTPHISGIGVSYIERMFQVLEQNLERKGKGERLLNIVDRKRQY